MTNKKAKAIIKQLQIMNLLKSLELKTNSNATLEIEKLINKVLDEII